MSIVEKIFQVDAFTSEPFRGNPAGVVLLSKERLSEWMLEFAMEMNLSETAFLTRLEPATFNLRWFTPAVEVDLCGHATLASAHVLFSEGLVKQDEIIFKSRSRILKAYQRDGWIELDFPAFKLQPIKMTADLHFALGLNPVSAFESDVNLLLELKTFQEVQEFKPDFSKLILLPYQGLIITSRMEGSVFDFASRYFAPRAGINEDPVTGSAHCSLAPFWSSRLGKNELNAFQASARGGELRVRLSGNRVFILGQAVTIFDGVLRI